MKKKSTTEIRSANNRTRQTTSVSVFLFVITAISQPIFAARPPVGQQTPRVEIRPVDIPQATTTLETPEMPPVDAAESPEPQRIDTPNDSLLPTTIKAAADDRQQLIGRWRMVEGLLDDNWWGYAGVLDQRRARERMDLVFEKAVCTQYRSTSGWQIRDDKPELVFVLPDGSLQTFEYQLEDDTLLLQHISDTRVLRKPVFRRVVDLKSTEPIPKGLRPFLFSGSLDSFDNLLDWKAGDRVDVLATVKLDSETLCSGGILIADVPIHAISGPNLNRPDTYNITILVPDAVFTEWEQFHVRRILERTGWCEMVTTGLNHDSRIVTAKEMNSLLVAISTLSQSDQYLQEYPDAVRTAIQEIPNWAKDHVRVLFPNAWRLVANDKPATLAVRNHVGTTVSVDPARKSIEKSLRSAEEECLRAASRYRELASASKSTADEISAAESNLRSQVKAAFELRWQSQDLQLKQTKAEIARLETTHQRRKRLADQVIDRRMEELKTGDELSWTQSAVDPKTTPANVVDNDFDSLQGFWFGLIEYRNAESEPVSVHIEGNKLSFYPGDTTGTFELPGEQQFRLKLTFPKLKLPARNHLGEYKLDDKTLTIRVRSGVHTLSLVLHRSPVQGPADMATSPTQTPSIAKIDQRLNGDWKLVSDVGTASLEPNTRLRVEDGQWTLRSIGRNREQRISVNTTTTPNQIDLSGQSAFSDVFSGIYKIENDVLTVAWAAFDGSSTRPTDFLSKDSNTQIWKRVPPLPTFATPEELLEYFGTGQNGMADMEKSIDVLTDEEATRFAGVMIASAGMMNRMMPLLMMSAQMDDEQGVPAEMAMFSKISTLLQNAVSPSAPPQCVKAFNEFTKPDTSFLTGQSVARSTDADIFSEKLKLAGGAVGDPRAFTIQLMRFMEAVGAAKDSDKKEDIPDPDWVVSLDGDKAIAVNQSARPSDNEMSNSRLELVRVDDTWKISKFIDDKAMAELAKTFSGGLVGTDSNGNEVALSSVFGPSMAVAESQATPQEFLTLKTALKERRFTDVDMSERLKPNTLVFTHEGEGVFPDFLPEYLSTAYERLQPDSDGALKAWQTEQFELLRSIDPAIQFAKVGNEWDLKRFGELTELYVKQASAKTTSLSEQDSPWSADMLTRIAKTTGKLPDVAFTTKHTDPDVRRRLKLLETMITNKATSTWIEQEEIRLHNLLLEAPVETIQLLIEHPAATNAKGYKQWLFVLSRKEFCDLLKSQPSRACGQPMDTVLLTLILRRFAGTSEAIDDRIALFLTTSANGSKNQSAQPYPIPMPPSSSQTAYITRQLHDLLSNDYAYRQFVVEALVDIYRKSKSESLRINISNFAPAIPVLAKQSEPTQ